MAAEDAAVVVTVRANLKDYEAALKSAVRSTERAAKAAEAAVAGIGKKASAAPIATVFQKSSQQIANDARVLQFQLNDIFSGVASGQGIRAVQQQLGQIAQQLGGGGLMASARTLGSAFVGMINPVNLAVVAFGALATVAASYFSDTDKDAEKATKELEKQTAAIRKLADEYGVLFPELERIANLREAEADAAGKAEAEQKALEGAYEDTRKALKGMDVDIADIVRMLETLGMSAENIVKLQEDFGKLGDAVDAHKASSEDAAAVVAALNTLIAHGTPEVIRLATAIRDNLVESFEELDRAAKSAGETMERALQTVGPGRGGDPMPAVRRHEAELDASLGKAADAIDSFVERVIQAESGGRAGAKNPLSTATGAGQFLTSTWLEVFKRNFAAEAAGMSDAAILALRTDVEANRRMIRAYAAENTRDLLRGGMEQVDEAMLHLAHFLGAGGALKVLKAAPGTKISDIAGMAGAIAANPSILGGGARREDVLAYASRRAGAPSRQKENTELADWLALSQQELDLKNKQLDINSQFWESEARRNAQMEEQRLIQEGLSAATKQYGEVTDEMRAKIEAAAHAQAFATVASEEAAERQKQFIERQKQNAQAMANVSQQINQLAQSAISGLVNDLRNGVDAGEAFNNMLNRIIDSLIQIGLQSFFSPTGAGGSFLSGLFGAAQSGGIVGQTAFPQRRVSPLAFAGAPRFASGGMVGLRSGEVPIIAHRGEMIVPRHMVGRGGAGGVTNNIGSIGVAVNTGPDRMVATTDDGKRLGAEIDRAVQHVMVRESRPGGLLRRVPG